MNGLTEIPDGAAQKPRRPRKRPVRFVCGPGKHLLRLVSNTTVVTWQDGATFLVRHCERSGCGYVDGSPVKVVPSQMRHTVSIRVHSGSVPFPPHRIVSRVWKVANA